MIEFSNKWVIALIVSVYLIGVPTTFKVMKPYFYDGYEYCLEGSQSTSCSNQASGRRLAAGAWPITAGVWVVWKTAVKPTIYVLDVVSDGLSQIIITFMEDDT